MDILSLFMKKKIGGYIKSYKLEKWWFDAFSDAERKYIVNKYNTIEENKNMLIEGVVSPAKENKAMFLVNLASRFSNKNEINIALRIIQKAEEEKNSSMTLSDQHFYYLQLIKLYYKDRGNVDSFNSAIKACNNQIKISDKVKKQFMKEFENLPSHTGFKQLAIIEEKRGNYKKAIELATRAKKGGWSGDWDKRIERCKTKISK